MPIVDVTLFKHGSCILNDYNQLIWLLGINIGKMDLISGLDHFGMFVIFSVLLSFCTEIKFLLSLFFVQNEGRNEARYSG